MKREEFNDAIADTVSESTGFDKEKDPDIRNWLSTQYGRRFAGIKESEPVKGICPICKEEGMIAVRRRNTAYADDENNWLESCDDCFAEDCAVYDEMWADYYSMVM